MAVANSQFKQYIKLSVSEGSNQCSPLVFGGFVFPRVHIFLWLLSNNKILTRMNLAKRQHVEDKTCLFCSEQETVGHLFFDCCVARRFGSAVPTARMSILNLTSPLLLNGGSAGTKYDVINMCTSAIHWSIWELRNNMCFQGQVWRT